MESNFSFTPFAVARRLLSLFWAVVSTSIYGIAVIVSRFFSIQMPRRISRIWARQLLAVGGVHSRVRGLEKIDASGKYIFVSNHQSLLDIPCMLANMPLPLTFIAKKELFSVPIFGRGIKSLGHVCIDRSSPRKARESFTLAVERLQKEDISLVIFPEGTRSVTGELGDFHRGSFTLAVESGLPVVPIAVVDTRKALPKNSMMIRSGEVALVIGDPIENPKALDKNALVEKTRVALAGLVGESGRPQMA
ncbi:MAG: 1-acyl-sn-glycerol-3-phosphate acyltransferase [Spirochaetes bacterium]|nr:1-acyl-sn-glycerol-3-phosphate acyltransferase [Spirochaetota bacterium]